MSPKSSDTRGNGQLPSAPPHLDRRRDDAEAASARDHAASSSPAARPASKAQRLPGLDGLRAISITLVMLAHARAVQGFPKASWLEQVAGRGPVGVSVFFVLSGFLITWLLVREEGTRGKIDLARFYVRRALRILPPAYVFLALATAWAAFHHRAVSVLEVVSCAAFFRNFIVGSEYFGHFWSLAIEEQFYLLWPAFLLLGRREHRLKVTAALVVAAPIWRFVNYRIFGVGAFDFMRTDLAYDGLLVGALLALVRADAGARRYLNRLTDRRGLAPACVVVFAALQCPLFLMSPKYGRLGLSASLLTVALLIHLLIENRGGAVGRFLELRPMVLLGKISYSLYLWQQMFLTNSNGSALELFPYAIVVPVLLASLSYAWIEKPILVLRGRLNL